MGVIDARLIQYAMTEDGVRIAFTAVGSGPPLIHLAPSGWGHAAAEWDVPELKYWYDLLSASFRLIRYDHRGFGSSDRAPVLETLEDRTHDLEAVVEALELETVAILGWQYGSPSAIRFAARHPDLVSHLILLNGGARSADFVQSNRTSDAMRQLMHDEWEAYAALMGLRTWGWNRAETARRWAALTSEAASAEAMEGHLAIIEEFDLSNELSDIRAKTLVAQQGGTVSQEGTALVARAIPDVAVVAWDRRHWQPWWDQETADAGFKLVSDFLLDGERPSESAGRPALQIVLFTDVEASTPLTQRLGDEGAQELLRAHNTTVRGALEEHGGREVKHTGDGIMASFPSAVSAVTAALQIQRGLAGGEVRVRVGLNAGEPIAEDDDLFGLSVIKAARIADRAEPGQVLVSNVVMELCEGKTFEFASLGAVSLKGFDDAVELFEVRG